MRSPNFTERRDGLRPELVVLHYTAMADCAAAARALCDPAREVSAHYLIARDGTVLALVDEEKRAWHAGTGSWRGTGDVNSRSIGIELDNDGASPFSEPLMAALEALLPGVLARWDIAPAGVIGHSDMAPLRKSDPGARFDWRRLARRDLAIWPTHEAVVSDVDADRFKADARCFGHPDVPFERLLEVVRLRFRPWARGPLDAEDCTIMADLAARYGVERDAAQA